MVVSLQSTARHMELLEQMSDELPDLRPALNGDNIKIARKAKGLTQTELGAVFDISGRAVRNWEKDLSEPHEEIRSQVARFLGLRDEPKIRGLGEALVGGTHAPELKMIKDHIDLMQKQLETVSYLLDRVLEPPNR